METGVGKDIDETDKGHCVLAASVQEVLPHLFRCLMVMRMAKTSICNLFANDLVLLSASDKTSFFFRCFKTVLKVHLMQSVDSCRQERCPYNILLTQHSMLDRHLDFLYVDR